MRSLTVKLTLVALIASLAGVVLVAASAQRTATQGFERFIAAQLRDEFIANVVGYYAEQGTWLGVQSALSPPAGRIETQPPRLGAPPAGPAPGAPPPNGAALPGGANAPERAAVLFILLDAAGCVVLPGQSYRVGDCLDAAQIARSNPVAVTVDDQFVGTVLTTGVPPELGAVERAYLTAMNRTLWIGAAGALLVALALGLLLARMMTRPLQELRTAIRAVQRGELQQEVPIRSRDELGEVAAAFNQMSSDLAHANEAQRQMTADIAHDLRNPLMVLSGYIESMRDGVLPPSPARLDTMHEEAQHLQRLVADLRTLSLADAGELTLARQPVSPHELLTRTADAYRHAATQQQIDLHMDAPSDLPAVLVDPERMTQVLGNLVSNALRYTPTHGTITLAARRSNDGVQLLVRDTGTGIAPDALPHIFDRAYRADPARVQGEGESGLGLAIARTLVTAHGGTIEASSQAGMGATFTITLPQAKP